MVARLVVGLRRRLDFGLPREVYVLQAGLVLNAFGNGAANPFALLYLHDVRHIPLPLAGVAAAISAGTALTSGLVGGSVADRIGPRTTTVVGLVLSAGGFACYPLVREAWQAFFVALLTGGGAGVWLTGQSALLAAIAPPAVRPLAFAQQRVAANIGLGLGGFVGGLIVSTSNPSSFTLLFILNSASFLGYTFFLMRLPSGASRVLMERPAGYREVLRDGALVRLAVATFLWVAAAVSLLNSLVPVFAHNEGGLDEAAIGFLFLLNSLTIVVFQIPIARSQQGRRRVRGLALMSCLFATAWLTLGVSGVVLTAQAAVVGFVVAIVVFSFAECVYDSIVGPLTADLAGELRGRYMAVSGFSWQLGFIVGPLVGATLLNFEPLALWVAAAATCLAGGALALRLEPRLPRASRVTPARSSPARPARALTSRSAAR